MGLAGRVASCWSWGASAASCVDSWALGWSWSPSPSSLPCAGLEMGTTGAAGVHLPRGGADKMRPCRAPPCARAACAAEGTDDGRSALPVIWRRAPCTGSCLAGPRRAGVCAPVATALHGGGSGDCWACSMACSTCRARSCALVCVATARNASKGERNQRGTKLDLGAGGRFTLACVLENAH